MAGAPQPCKPAGRHWQKPWRDSGDREGQAASVAGLDQPSPGTGMACFRDEGGLPSSPPFWVILSGRGVPLRFQALLSCRSSFLFCSFWGRSFRPGLSFQARGSLTACSSFSESGSSPGLAPRRVGTLQHSYSKCRTQQPALHTGPLALESKVGLRCEAQHSVETRRDVGARFCSGSEALDNHVTCNDTEWQPQIVTPKSLDHKTLRLKKNV